MVRGLVWDRTRVSAARRSSQPTEQWHIIIIIIIMSCYPFRDIGRQQNVAI